VHSDNVDWTRRAKEILERTGAQDISSSAEATADYAKSDRPVGRTASDVEAVQVQGKKKATSVEHHTGPSQCPHCGLAVHSEAELRDHEKTCVRNAARLSSQSELNPSKVVGKAAD
jgi:hypothetical protein